MCVHNAPFTHTRKGCEIIDDLLNDFGFENIDHINMLRNIVEFHHEAVDGTGYPSGKKGSEIPLESRIVSVADVFDALTSKRTYKEAWDNKKAIQMLMQMAGEKLDKDCVDALVNNMDQVEDIQKKFTESGIYG